MPCDPFTEAGYFQSIEQMVHAVDDNGSDLVLMGITPTYPSAKYGYVVPDELKLKGGIFSVKRFTEKPNVATAEYLIKENVFWNGGVFAFKLGYMMNMWSNISGLFLFRKSVTDIVNSPKSVSIMRWQKRPNW